MTTPVCKIRSVSPFDRKHIVKDDRARYWIRCRLCATGGLPYESMFGDERTLGWAIDLEGAIRFADAHAAIHLDKTCPHCAHTPQVDVTTEDTNALMTARSAQ